jgi:hypothetical protein
MIDIRAAARALGGEVVGGQVLAPGPNHGPKDRSLSVKFTGGDGFIVCSFAGDPFDVCRDHVASLLGISGKRNKALPPTWKLISRPEVNAEQQERTRFAIALWEQSRPLRGTLGERYLIETRKLNIGDLNFDHCLRWNNRTDAIVGLMTDPLTDEPTGVHRTYIEPDATKRERKMLGKMGVIKLSPHGAVISQVAIIEGIEKGIFVLLHGFTPMWVACSAVGIKNFPVIKNVTSLTIWRDDDEVGERAANECATRWARAGAKVGIVTPRAGVR